MTANGDSEADDVAKIQSLTQPWKSEDAQPWGKGFASDFNPTKAWRASIGTESVMPLPAPEKPCPEVPAGKTEFKDNLEKRPLQQIVEEHLARTLTDVQSVLVQAHKQVLELFEGVDIAQDKISSLPLRERQNIGSMCRDSAAITSAASTQHDMATDSRTNWDRTKGVTFSESFVSRGNYRNQSENLTSADHDKSSMIKRHDPGQWSIRQVWKEHAWRESDPSIKEDRIMKGNKGASKKAFLKHHDASQQLDRLDISTLASGHRRNFIIHPNSMKRASWDMLSMLMVLYDVFAVPFSLFEPPQTMALIAMSWTTRIFWTGDLMFSFCGGYITTDGTIEMRRRNIAMKYLRSWFALDFFLVVFDWLDSAVGSSSSSTAHTASRIFRIVRFLRIARLAKAGVIVNVLAEKLYSEELMIIVGVFKLMTIMTSLGHCLACVWYAIGIGHKDSENWVDIFDFVEEDLATRYIISMRWSLSQFSGGMDEVTPQNFAEHCWSGFAWMAAWWAGTGIVSIVTSHITQLHMLGNHQSLQLKAITMYMKQNGISAALASRVIRNVQNNLRMRKARMTEEAVGIVALVSTPVLREMHFEMYYPVLAPHPFFEDFVVDNRHVVEKICHRAMYTRQYAKDDKVFFFGEAAEDMVFISHGLVRYTWGNRMKELGVGKWLTEAVLWIDFFAHQGTLAALEDARFCNLNADKFATAVKGFELVDFDLIGYVNLFMERIRSLAENPNEVSDMPFREPIYVPVPGPDITSSSSGRRHRKTGARRGTAAASKSFLVRSGTGFNVRVPAPAAAAAKVTRVMQSFRPTMWATGQSDDSQSAANDVQSVVPPSGQPAVMPH